MFLGAFITTVGVFLPWYKDVDKFRTGDTFLGINGPLYLAGILVFLAAASTFLLIGFDVLGKRKPKLPIKENYWHLSGGALSVLMLILTNSVYFHPKFGINLTDKSIGIGMMMAFVGVGFVVLGSALSIGKKDVNFEEEGHLKPLIDINERVQERVGSLDKEEHDFDQYKKSTPAGIQESIDDFSEDNQSKNGY